MFETLESRDRPVERRLLLSMFYGTFCLVVWYPLRSV
jgi:hypothetical protein